MRKLRHLMTATFLIMTAAIAARNGLAQNDNTEARAMFSQAVQLFNAQKYLEAKPILAKLVE
ncbi:MAG TPA: hypothetical protein VG324_22595, partial [Blastocatellia bacterium]|nr:hypothetical protein [Blastocatellia bacterium]